MYTMTVRGGVGGGGGGGGGGGLVAAGRGDPWGGAIGSVRPRGSWAGRGDP